MACRNVCGVTSEFYSINTTANIMHTKLFFFFFFFFVVVVVDIVNQILNTTNTFFMLHNFDLVKVYVHGVTLSQKAVK